MVAAGRLLLLAGFLVFSLLTGGSALLPGHRASLMIIGAAIVITLLLSAWYYSGRQKRLLNYTQILLDLLFITLAVWLTGAMDSPFVFLYPVAIIAACLQAGRRGGSVALILALASFGAIVLTGPAPNRTGVDRIKLFFINMAAFSATAYLGRELVRQMSQAQERLDSTRQRLKQSREIQRHLADSIEAGLVVMDEEGEIILWNRAAQRITGIGQAQALGRKLSQVLPQLEKALQGGGGNGRVELELPDSEGRSRIIGMSSFPLMGDGVSLGHGIIFQDITEERRRAMRLQRIDRLVALGEMAAGLAHEIRNPLASISGVTQFMKEQGLVHEQGRKLLELMERECDRLTRITENFLQYARPAKGQLHTVPVRREVEEAVELIQRRKGLPRAQVNVEIPGDLELSADRAQFRQILHNTLLNAFQAVSDGGHIGVKGRQEGERLILTIEDDGIGIPQELMDKIFDPFFTTRQDGTGLGLSIVHNIVISWGGELCVERREEGGTRFRFSLPISPSHRDPGPDDH